MIGWLLPAQTETPLGLQEVTDTELSWTPDAGIMWGGGSRVGRRMGGETPESDLLYDSPLAACA